MDGKHCEYMDLGDNVSAIACGVPDSCDHDSDGQWYTEIRYKETGETEWFAKSLLPDLSTKEGQQFMDEWLYWKNAAIVGGSSSCSKCGKLAADCIDYNMF